MKRVVVSGGFDPVHVGHICLFNEARELGDHLTVILNTDNFLMQKKGYIFMPFNERKAVIENLRAVDSVVESIDEDNTVIETIKKLKKQDLIDIFANGGDRREEKEIPEFTVCKNLEIETVFNIGGEKIQSSSALIKPFENYIENRSWGYFENLEVGKNYLVKRIVVNKNEKLSVQYHRNRTENWVVVSGKGRVMKGKQEMTCNVGSSFFISKEEIHSLENTGKDPLILIEIQIGENLSEEDIVRLEDKYGRVN